MGFGRKEKKRKKQGWESIQLDEAQDKEEDTQDPLLHWKWFALGQSANPTAHMADEETHVWFSHLKIIERERERERGMGIDKATQDCKLKNK